MARPSKDYVSFTGRIRKESAEKLTDLCDSTGLTKTSVVEKSIDLYHMCKQKQFAGEQIDSADIIKMIL